MQKISLKPISKELVYKGDEPFSFFDAFSYSGTNAQEKGLGSLIVVGNVKYDDSEDLSYVINLLSSLAKREYYAEQSVKDQDPKAAFQRTLTKLNEVLEDFFENKKFSSDIGLVAVAGEHLYISKLGKFKVALARDEEYIDVLNHIGLFEKSDRSEQRFSNIISGTVKANDRLLAYIPFRAVTIRERKLKNIFVYDEPSQYEATLAALSEGPKAFQFCGAYLKLEEIKEIPAGAAPSYRVMDYSAKARLAGNDDDEKDIEGRIDDSEDTISTPGDSPNDNTADNGTRVMVRDDEDRPASRAIQSDMTMGSRSTVFSTLGKWGSSLKSLGKRNAPGRKKAFVIVATIIIVPLLAIMISRSSSNPSDFDLVLAQATREYDEAKLNISQNDSKGARSLLRSALASISSYSDNEEANSLSFNIEEQLRSIDKVQAISPSMFADYSQAHSTNPLIQLVISGDDLYGVDQRGTIFELASNESKSLKKLDALPRLLFSTDKRVSFLSEENTFAVYNLETANSGVFELDAAPSEIVSAQLYDDNLYALARDGVYKYTDANTGDIEFNVWLEDLGRSSNFVSLSIDGNIYILSEDGSIGTYFKGELGSEFDSNINVSASTRLFSLDEGTDIYIFSPSESLIRTYSKEGGVHLSSFDLSSLGVVRDVAFTGTTLWVLVENKVWSIAL